MCSHRGNYKAWCKDNTCSYTSSFEILKYDDAYIELLEECPCENSAQLHKKEGEYIRLHIDVCVNVRIAGRPSNERYKIFHEIHKEERNAQQKIYREANKEQINAKRRERRNAKKALATDP
jgi:hypothetical protein